MFINNPYLGECDSDMLLALELRVEQFESAWRDDPLPELSDFLPADTIARRATLLELVHVDLECRLKAGHSAQVEEYLQRYPELCEDQTVLIELIEAASRLRQQYQSFASVAATVGLDAKGTNAPAATQRQLGKFQLLEELGSGAFGTVYRARDTSLARIVAVKVSRSSLESREEQDRFYREARSAAALRHPGIVAVHEVGQSEGRCYLVSDVVAGPTLAHRLSAGRPSFRESAQIVAGVAEALHYAHQQGVIHRDIKPSNILIDADDRPLVVDFGLSRQTSDHTLTVEGQVLGTPAYMPPEQAQGDSRHADARSDVYSLGAVFYELLTGVTPFQGKGEMLLLRILHEEPLALRRLDGAIPRDLDVICLKALCKEPAGRYQTAADLAEELRRFLRGEPIRTHPPSAAGRLVRWCRRKPVVAGLLAAVLFVTLGGLAGITAAWRKAEVNLAEARRQKDEAERSFRETRQVIREIHQLGSRRLIHDQFNVAPLDAELVETSLKYYETFLQRKTDDPALRLDTAKAYLHLGRLYAFIPGNSHRIAGAYRKILPFLLDVVKDRPEDQEIKRELAEMCFHLGRVCFRDGHNDDALPILNQACDLLTAQSAAESHDITLGMKAACAHQLLGRLLDDAAHLQTAEREYRRMLDYLEELHRKEPNARAHAQFIAEICYQLGIMKCDKGDGSAGKDLFEKQHAMLKNLVKDAPDDINLQIQLATNLFHIARAQDRSDSFDAALASFRGAALLWQEIHSKRPTDDRHLGTLATCYHKIGILEWDSGHPDKAIEPLQQALALRQKLCRLTPQNPARRSNLSGTWYRLAEILEELKRFAQAEEAYRQAIVLEQTLLDQQPGRVDIRKHICEHYEGIARMCRMQGRTPEAEKAEADARRIASSR